MQKHEVSFNHGAYLSDPYCIKSITLSIIFQIKDIVRNICYCFYFADFFACNMNFAPEFKFVNKKKMFRRLFSSYQNSLPYSKIEKLFSDFIRNLFLTSSWTFYPLTIKIWSINETGVKNGTAVFICYFIII